MSEGSADEPLSVYEVNPKSYDPCKARLQTVGLGKNVNMTAIHFNLNSILLDYRQSETLT